MLTISKMQWVIFGMMFVNVVWAKVPSAWETAAYQHLKWPWEGQ
jgi:hypothetical protein